VALVAHAALFSSKTKYIDRIRIRAGVVCPPSGSEATGPCGLKILAEIAAPVGETCVGASRQQRAEISPVKYRAIRCLSVEKQARAQEVGIPGALATGDGEEVISTGIGGRVSENRSKPRRFEDVWIAEASKVTLWPLIYIPSLFQQSDRW
jgi:hypothetical protein